MSKSTNRQALLGSSALSPSSYSLSVTLAAALTLAMSLPVLALPVQVGEMTNASGTKIEEARVEPASIENDATQTPDGKDYQITRTTINASPEEVFGILVDYKKSGLLFSNLTKSEVLSRDENTKTSNVSFSLKGILNLWSFDYVLSIKENFPSSIEFHRVSGAFKRNEGYWKLIPLDNGRRTQVVYCKYIDSGLMVPPQLVAKQVRESTFSVVQNLKKVSETENQKLASHH